MSRVHPSQVAELEAPRRIERPLSVEERGALAKIRSRKELQRTPLYQKRLPAIDAATYGLAYGMPTSRAPRPERGFVRVAAWNIQRGNSFDGIRQALLTEPTLRQVDIFLLLEVDLGMARSANRDVASELAEALGFEHVFGTSYVCLDHGDVRDGEQSEENRVGFHGNAILSRWPLRRAESFSLAITRDKFMSSEKRLGHKKALWAEVETPLGLLPTMALHLDSIASPSQRAAQLRDATAKAEERGLKRLLIGGDLNTNTYDVQSTPRLLWSILQKGLRGGFRHAVPNYMSPYALYEKAVFDALTEAGLDWRSFNDLEDHSIAYVVGSEESESNVREQLPEFVVRYLRRKLKPWNGVAPLKLDWFAARELQVLSREERPGSQTPRVVHVSEGAPVRLSDHDPIVVDLTW